MNAIKPVAPYVGGKFLLAKEIIRRIQTIPHRTYAEPFIGMGGVFLRRPEAAKAEVINDINRDVWCLFRVLQDHYGYFVDYLKFRLASRTEFERLKAVNPDTLTDIQRAARFLYLQRMAFGGKVTSRVFGVCPDRHSRFNLTRLVPMLDDLHTRLADVTMECLPYAEFILRYDRPDTLFYLDPPYWGVEGYYGKGVFDSNDFDRMAHQLRGIRGKFLLSINDTPDIWQIFSGFNIHPVTTAYSIGCSTTKRAAELLISNT